jgi:hypothetical protein
VGDEHLLAEACGAFGVCGNDDLGGHAAQIAPSRRVLGVEDEGDEGGAAGDDVEAELLGELVAEVCGSHLRDGEASGGDDYGGGLDGAGAGLEEESCGSVRRGDGVDGGSGEDAHACVLALALEHGDDLLRGAVAEELAEGLLVVLDAVLLDEGNDVGGSEAGEGGFGEVRVGGEEVFGAGVDVCEVAAASAGDEDLLADAVGVIEDKDAPRAPSGLDGAHQSCGACSKYYDINGMHAILSPDPNKRVATLWSLLPEREQS